MKKKIALIPSHLLLLPLLIFLAGCTETSNTTNLEILDNNREAFVPQNAIRVDKPNLSDFYELESLTLLTFPEGIFIRDIDYIKVSEHRIFILDRFSAKQIFVFDEEGNYLYRINEFGEGPGKYSMLMGFTISHDGKEVLIVDSNRQNILHYDISNGAFLRSTSFNFPGLDIARIPGGLYVFNTNESKSIVVTDQDFKVVYQSVDRDYGLRLNQPFLELPDKTLYVQSYDENVYVIGEQETKIWRKAPTHDFDQLKTLKQQYPATDQESVREFRDRARELGRRRAFMEYQNGFAYFSSKPNATRKYIRHFTSGKNFELYYNEIINDLTYTELLPMYASDGFTDKYQGIGYVRGSSTSKEEIVENIAKWGEIKYAPQMRTIADQLLREDERDQIIFCLFNLKAEISL